MFRRIVPLAVAAALGAATFLGAGTASAQTLPTPDATSCATATATIADFLANSGLDQEIAQAQAAAFQSACDDLEALDDLPNNPSREQCEMGLELIGEFTPGGFIAFQNACERLFGIIVPEGPGDPDADDSGMGNDEGMDPNAGNDRAPGQVTRVPVGSVDTGDGSTIDDGEPKLLGGLVLAAAAGGALAARRLLNGI